VKLNPIQQLVAKHYCGGEFAHITDTDEVVECGDTLFTFLMVEADDVSLNSEYRRRLLTADTQISDLRHALFLEEMQ
jgi:hypothetical protein